MILPAPVATLIRGATTLPQFLDSVEDFLGALFGWLGTFLLGRLEFADRYPTSALSGILVNAVVFWWLVHAQFRATLHRVVVPQFLLR